MAEIYSTKGSRRTKSVSQINEQYRRLWNTLYRQNVSGTNSYAQMRMFRVRNAATRYVANIAVAQGDRRRRTDNATVTNANFNQGGRATQQFPRSVYAR